MTGRRVSCSPGDDIADGEVERAGDDVRGVAVHLAGRVCDATGAHEVLVSNATAALIAGSGLMTTSRGLHGSKGTDGEVELAAVTAGAWTPKGP